MQQPFLPLFVQAASGSERKRSVGSVRIVSASPHFLPRKGASVAIGVEAGLVTEAAEIQVEVEVEAEVLPLVPSISVSGIILRIVESLLCR